MVIGIFTVAKTAAIKDSYRLGDTGKMYSYLQNSEQHQINTHAKNSHKIVGLTTNTQSNPMTNLVQGVSYHWV